MHPSLSKTAASATLHCLAGCSVGEILGMVCTSAAHLKTGPSVAVSILLAFVFGYGLSMWPLRRHGLPWKQVLALALAADTASITVMELTDNAFILVVPGAISAGLNTLLFWWSLALSLLLAFLAAFPLNRWLISRGKGHAVVHAYHHTHKM